MKHERVIAGLACSEVLARLSDYVEDELPAPERARLEAHVRACEHCARFGGAFAAIVQGLRTRLGAAPLSSAARRRILDQV